MIILQRVIKLLIISHTLHAKFPLQTPLLVLQDGCDSVNYIHNELLSCDVKCNGSIDYYHVGVVCLFIYIAFVYLFLLFVCNTTSVTIINTSVSFRILCKGGKRTFVEL